MNQKKAYTFIAIGFALGVGLTTLVFILILAPEDKPGNSAVVPKTTIELQEKLVEDLGEDRAGRILGNCRILGTVLDHNDSPIKDASVRLRLLDEPWATSDIDLTIKTNENGEFMQPGLSPTAKFAIWAYAPGFAIGSSDQVRCDTSTDLVLEPGIDLTVNFQADTEAISELTVIIGGDVFWPPRQSSTDENGQIVIGGLAEGQYEIWAYNEQHAFLSSEPFTLENKGPAEQTFELSQARTEKVILATTKGTPLASTSITIKPTPGSLLSRQATSDKQGRVLIDGIPETLEELTLNTIGVFAPAHVNLTGDDPSMAQFNRGIVLKGKIQTAGGMPIAGVDLDVSEIHGPQVSTLLGSTKGGFLGRLFRASREGWPSMVASESGGKIPGPLRITLPDLSFQSGTTAPSTQVTGPWQPTDNDGRFVLSGLPAGRVRLEARHRDYVARSSVDLRLYEDIEPDELTIEMRRGSTATVRTTDEQGKPLEDIEVLVYDSFEQIIASAHTNSEGIAELRGLPGVCRIIASSPQKVPSYRDIQERIGRHFEVQLRLPEATREIVGQVLNKDGNGVPGTIVTARSISKGLLHSLAGTTENDGTFALKGAGSGSYRIIADAGDKGRAQIGDITFNEEVKLVLGSGTGYLPPTGTIGPSLALGNNTWTDNLGTTGNVVPSTGLTTTTEYGEAEQLVVTAKPSGRGGVPIKVIGKGGRVMVAGITPGSRASEAGIKKGDQILAIDGRDVKGPSQARKALLGTIGTVVMLEVESKSGERFTAIVQREHVPGAKK